MKPIDFVIPWVDDSDPVWRAKKEAYTGKGETEGNTAVRYRDWETLKYWFRGVERFAPWVRYVFLITDQQMPQWLKKNHLKLRIVDHKDYIPLEYLPTFSTNPIELNLHRIQDLSENFVYFNDDMFLIDNVKPTDFFRNDLPCDMPTLGPLYPNGFFSRMLFNNIELINRHFSLKNCIRKHPVKWIIGQPVTQILKLVYYGRSDFVPNSVSRHIHTPLVKSTFERVWKMEEEVLHNTCLHKLRNKDDVTVYCIRDWQLFSGVFYPYKIKGRLFHTATMSDNDDAIRYLSSQKGKVICLNDSEDETDFEDHKTRILEAFAQLLSEKSSFEI